MLHYIHRVDINNVGDMFSGYYKYFYNDLRKYNLTIHDIWHIDFNKIRKDDCVIFGGGGMIDCQDSWNANINRILNICNNVIFWSLGNNRFNDNRFNNQNISVNIEFDKVNLLAIRDYKHESGFRYVPCASCMTPYLNMKDDIKREIGIITHKDFIIENNEYDKISNSSNIYEIIDFIRSSKVIISNSYHNIYWASLMKRKVITMGILHSNKFDYFKYTPNKYTGDIISDINNAKIYEYALEESRDLTVNYFNEIKAYLKATQTSLYNINFDSNEKYYNDFEIYASFNNYIESVNKNHDIGKLNNKIVELNNKCEDIYNRINKIILAFNKFIDMLVWWIPIRKFRDNFREKFKMTGQDRTGQDRTPVIFEYAYLKTA